MSLVGFSANNHPQQVRRDGANLDVDDRETPPEIFEPLDRLHNFTLDAAASATNRKAPRYFGIETNGLEQSWSGERVWCNPPYSDIGAWVEKAWREMDAGTETIVMLLPSNRTEQRWWQRWVEPYRDGPTSQGVKLVVRFLPGRPRFFRPSGKVGGPKGDRPPFGCCVLTWRHA